MNAEAIPGELRERPQWVLWRHEMREGAPTKVPHGVRGRASSIDPETWMAFADAVDAAGAGEFEGVGYVFSPDDPFCGVDLDGCRDPETGELDPEARAIIDRLNSYTEASQSGRGVHVLIRAEKPGKRSRIGRVELYDADRFFVMTAEHLDGTPEQIEERQAELEALYVELFPEPSPNGRPAAPSRPVELADTELLERMLASRSGGRIEQLWRGDTSAYGGDDSSADLALCSHLAFWTDRDAARMDTLFRHSGLNREKWDSRRGDSTYGRQTIEKAISSTQEGYRPHGDPHIGRDDQNGLDHPPALTDLGNAELFAWRHAHRLRHVRERRQWLFYRDGRWRPDLTGEAERAAKDIARERLRAAADITDEDKQKKHVAWAMASQSGPRLREMLSVASTEPPIALAADELDTDPFLLSCANGTVDLRSGKLRKPDPDA